MGTDTLDRSLRALLRPPPKMSTATWIESNVHLPASGAALPGRMRLYPYQRGWADAFDDPAITTVTILKSARVGYSAMLQGIIAASVANAPAPLILLRPTQDDARRGAVDLEQVFDASPSLRGLLSNDPSDRSTMYDRRFPGGSLKFTAARAPRNLRDITAKVLLADEVDAYEATDEGDALALAIMRTTTYRDRKILIGSTPVFDSGPVCRSYEKSDKRIWEVPCPSCGEFTEIRFVDLRWEHDDPSTTHWVCPSSGCVVTEDHQPSMIAGGRWRATAPEVIGHAGFRINALSSPHPNQRWSALVAEFLEKRTSPETLQTYTNTVLAEPWRVADGEGLDEEGLASRREPFGLDRLPAEVLVLTCGVDVQADRLEAVVMGFGRDDAIFVLAHEVFYGPVESQPPWVELDSFLKQSWSHPLGGSIRLDCTFVDSGYRPDIVTAFTRPRASRRIYASKGVPGFSQPVCHQSKNQKYLWLPGTDVGKARLFNRLERPNCGGIRWSDSLESVFFEQLASERLVKTMRAGVAHPQFLRIPGRDAETLDCVVYAWAARSIVKTNLDQREVLLSSPVAPVALRPKAPDPVGLLSQLRQRTPI